MLKFKDITGAIVDYLKHKMPELNCEAGKYGELPSITPAIWVYIEPYRNALTNYNSIPIVKQAKVTLFAIADASVDKYNAMIKSVELIEEVEQYLISEEFENYLNNHNDNVNNLLTNVEYASEQALNFDNIYSDYAVAYLELLINYS